MSGIFRGLEQTSDTVNAPRTNENTINQFRIWPIIRSEQGRVECNHTGGQQRTDREGQLVQRLEHGHIVKQLDPRDEDEHRVQNILFK